MLWTCYNRIYPIITNYNPATHPYESCLWALRTLQLNSRACLHPCYCWDKLLSALPAFPCRSYRGFNFPLWLGRDEICIGLFYIRRFDRRGWEYGWIFLITPPLIALQTLSRCLGYSCKCWQYKFCICYMLDALWDPESVCCRHLLIHAHCDFLDLEKILGPSVESFSQVNYNWKINHSLRIGIHCRITEFIQIKR